MNRLQKKCLVGVAGTHLLVVVAVLCSGFILPTPKAPEMQLLEILPDVLKDTPENSGVRNPQPPPPTRTMTPQPPQVQPQPQVQPPPQPQRRVEPVEQPPEPEQLQPDPNAFKPLPKKPKEPHKVVVNLDDKVTRKVAKPVDEQAEKEKEAKQEEQERQEAEQEARRLQAARGRAVRNALNTISSKASSSTEIQMPGDSSVSYANYGLAVISAYHRAWISPDNMAQASAVVSFSVTIARDGHVISSRITSRSGDASVNSAVQRMLNRVSFVHEFPEDTTDRERTYQIDFNATRTSTQ